MKILLSAIAATLVVLCVGFLIIGRPADLPVEDEPAEFDCTEMQCLALTVYYEARGSIAADKAAVADVVINRSRL